MENFLNACRTGDIDSLRSSTTGMKEDQLRDGLLEAMQAHQVAATAFLLEYGVPIDHMVFTWAARAESQAIWACLFDHGFDINSTEHGSALRLSTGSPELVSWLLDQGADPNLSVKIGPGRSWRSTALTTALASNDLESMKILVARGAKLEGELFEKCVSGLLRDKIGVETLQFLLDSGLDPNVVVDGGRGTPLQLAVRRGMPDKARALLQAGASAEVHDKDGATLLEEALKTGNEATVQLLVDYSNPEQRATSSHSATQRILSLRSGVRLVDSPARATRSSNART